MSTTPVPVCACDAANTSAITNPPAQSQIAFRAGDFNSFRTALLTPLLASPGQPPPERSLTAWKSGAGAEPSVVDLAVMMVEWWGYLCDILTFYNERIANEDYLRTAKLPETPGELIQILGYRPRPGIGAVGTLAGFTSSSILPGQTVQLPQGLQFQSKPLPGQSPQNYQLTSAAAIGVPSQVMATTPPNLVANLSGGSYGVLLQGKVTTVGNGSLLLLGPRDNSAPTLITLNAVPSPQTSASGQSQTQLSFTPQPAKGLNATNASLTRANQSAALWTANGSPVDATLKIIQLATLARQIRPNDYVVFTAPGQTPQLVQVTQVTDILGDAAVGGSPTTVGSEKTPIPVLHTQLTLASALSWNIVWTPAAVSVLFGWVDVGTLVNQPPSPWDGVSTNLIAIQPAQFVPGASVPVLLQDSVGVGQQGIGTVNSDGSLTINWPVTTPTPLNPALQPPISVLYNLLAVNQGKTVTNEVVGSGDATIAGQDFTLAKSPVTYLANGAAYKSTITLTVNGQPWAEVPSFYGQPMDAQVFITREDSQQMTHVEFGDGLNGARLPTGTNNVVATYQYGAGANSPPAGKLTVIAQSYPGLQSIANPVAVSGGSDPDPASLIKEYAPRSVLAFNRAVSVFDYQAIAAQAPGVTMASAYFSWDAANQRASVTVYVAGEQNVATTVQNALVTAGDPNRPVRVLPAVQLSVTLNLVLIVKAGFDQPTILNAVISALTDPQTGLFSPPQIGIGQPVFDSQIEAAVQAIQGVVGISSKQFEINGAVDPGPLHVPGEGSYFSLAAANCNPIVGGTQ